MNKKEIVKTVAPAVVSVGIMTGLQSLYLHRGETHGAIRPKPKTRLAMRVGTWLLSGMKPREYVAVHEKHHANEDRPGDPHSPAMLGRFGVPKVTFGNVIYYRRAVAQLEESDIRENLRPDKLDRMVLDRSMLGQLTLFGIFAAIHRGNLKRAAATLAVHDATVVMAGGVINGISHRGRDSVLRSLTHAPRPNDDGSYHRNLGPILTAVTFGEGNHAEHHANPGSLVLNENPILDAGGVIGTALIASNLAERGVRQ